MSKYQCKEGQFRCLCCNKVTRKNKCGSYHWDYDAGDDTRCSVCLDCYCVLRDTQSVSIYDLRTAQPLAAIRSDMTLNRARLDRVLSELPKGRTTRMKVEIEQLAQSLDAAIEYLPEFHD